MSEDATWRVTARFIDGAGKSWKVSRQIQCLDPWQAQKVAAYLMRRSYRGPAYRAWLKQEIDAPRLVAGTFSDYDWSMVA